MDLDFGPKSPAGKEANWIETVSGKGWFTLFRLYGPLEPWFDKTWQPGEIDLLKERAPSSNLDPRLRAPRRARVLVAESTDCV